MFSNLFTCTWYSILLREIETKEGCPFTPGNYQLSKLTSQLSYCNAKNEEPQTSHPWSSRPALRIRVFPEHSCEAPAQKKPLALR